MFIITIKNNEVKNKILNRRRNAKASETLGNEPQDYDFEFPHHTTTLRLKVIFE